MQSVNRAAFTREEKIDSQRHDDESGSEDGRGMSDSRAGPVGEDEEDGRLGMGAILFLIVTLRKMAEVFVSSFSLKLMAVSRHSRESDCDEAERFDTRLRFLLVGGVAGGPSDKPESAADEKGCWSDSSAMAACFLRGLIR